MGARLRVFLTCEQDKTLLNLRSGDVPQKVKDRAEAIRLNAHGWYVEKIAAH
ncbi:transposase [Scytonema sp. HK-05]|nr:transposase [Scytonema sp. HK-05]